MEMILISRVHPTKVGHTRSDYLETMLLTPRLSITDPPPPFLAVAWSVI